MKKLVLTIVALALSLAGMDASAQLGGLFKSDKQKATSTSGDVMAAGVDLLAYIGLANDQGVQAANKVVEMYPPEKVESIKKLSAQYADMKAKKGSGNVDAEMLKVSSDLSAEMAKLGVGEEWKGYKKEKASVSASAYGRLGLMVLADGVAAGKIKPTVESLQTAAKEAAANPVGGVAKAGQIKDLISVLTEAGKSLPKQVESGNAVRTVLSNVAKAEKIKLTEVKAADVADAKTMETSSKAIDG
jgi:hypothetical protein